MSTVGPDLPPLSSTRQQSLARASQGDLIRIPGISLGNALRLALVSATA